VNDRMQITALCDTFVITRRRHELYTYSKWQHFSVCNQRSRVEYHNSVQIWRQDGINGLFRPHCSVS